MKWRNMKMYFKNIFLYWNSKVIAKEMKGRGMACESSQPNVQSMHWNALYHQMLSLLLCEMDGCALSFAPSPLLYVWLSNKFALRITLCVHFESYLKIFFGLDSKEKKLNQKYGINIILLFYMWSRKVWFPNQLIDGSPHLSLFSIDLIGIFDLISLIFI